MVRSAERGAVVFGPNGVRYLDEDRVEGEDPTALFGEHTVMSLKREDAMTHAPDLLLLSQYDPEMGEVAAFEELIGSHGGLGGPQTEPFILHPARVGARRAGPARRAGDLPEPPALARARSASSSGKPAPSAPVVGPSRPPRSRSPRASRPVARRLGSAGPCPARRGVVAWGRADPTPAPDTPVPRPCRSRRTTP